MAKELAHADASIRQKHYELQKSDPAYWDEDKRQQESDGVVPDPVTGKAYPILTIVAPDVFDSSPEGPSAEWEIEQQRHREEQQASERAPESEESKNGASIIDMVRAAPKVFSAMLKPSDSPMVLKRLEVCKGCEHWTGSKCRKCGCFTSLKVRLPSEACPIGKWAKEE